MIDPSLISMIGGGRQAAAARARQQAEEEEEEMAEHSDAELVPKHEFKIFRSGTGAFRHRDTLRDALDEEAQAGWTLVEKLDDHRVRLIRPTAASLNDLRLDFDPYRTWFGVSNSGLVVRGVVVSALVALAVGAVVLAVYLANK